MKLPASWTNSSKDTAFMSCSTCRTGIYGNAGCNLVTCAAVRNVLTLLL